MSLFNKPIVRNEEIKQNGIQEEEEEKLSSYRRFGVSLSCAFSQFVNLGLNIVNLFNDKKTEWRAGKNHLHSFFFWFFRFDAYTFRAFFTFLFNIVCQFSIYLYNFTWMYVCSLSLSRYFSIISKSKWSYERSTNLNVLLIYQKLVKWNKPKKYTHTTSKQTK